MGENVSWWETFRMVAFAACFITGPYLLGCCWGTHVEITRQAAEDD